MQANTRRTVVSLEGQGGQEECGDARHKSGSRGTAGAEQGQQSRHCSTTSGKFFYPDEEATCYSEMLANSYQNTRNHIPEDDYFHNECHENHKSCMYCSCTRIFLDLCVLTQKV
jgi:hypothetical protein